MIPLLIHTKKALGNYFGLYLRLMSTIIMHVNVCATFW